MNKKDLIIKLSARTNWSKTASAQAVQEFLDLLGESLAGGKEVRLTGFGSFRLAERRERTVRHPLTGENLVVPEHKTVRFRPAKHLKKL